MKPFLSDNTPVGFVTAEAEVPYAASLLEAVERLRFEVSAQLNPQRQAEMGQYFTPASVAVLMASMMRFDQPEIRLLDPGAGIGTLFAACIAVLCSKANPPETVHVTAYEADPLFQGYLKIVADLCRQECERVGVRFSVEIQQADFIQEAVNFLSGDLFAPQAPRFNAAILNPPYHKIHSESVARQLLRRVGVETTNLYTGFFALTIQLLARQSEMVAITPRSFCNGTYFRPFRKLLLEQTYLHRIHLFDSREEAFQDDKILQETIIVQTVKGDCRPQHIVVTTSTGIDDDLILRSELPYESVVVPDDPEQFIRIVADDIDVRIAGQMSFLTSTLQDMGLSVSTGRVVDFRAKSYLRAYPEYGTAPLLYPTNLEGERSDGRNTYGSRRHLLYVKRPSCSLCPTRHMLW